MAIYERHRPESTVLYQSVARAWPKIEVEYAINDQSIAPHVPAEFERYTRCGILEHGFVRLYCKDCQAERIVGLTSQMKQTLHQLANLQLVVHQASIGFYGLSSSPKQWVSTPRSAHATQE